MWDFRRGNLIGRAYRRLVPRHLRHHLEFIKVHGRPAYLPWAPPTSYMGKVVWRIHHDRRDILRPLGDKLAMKDLARAVGVSVPATLWAGTDPAELAEASRSFEGRWVLKPNHTSQRVHFFEGPIEVEEASAATQGWTDIIFGTAHGEWAYLFARPLIIAEEALTPEGADLPDYKFLTFNGEPQVCWVVEGRFGNTTHTYYKVPEWERIDAVTSGMPAADATLPPRELPAMLDAARRLGEGYDFIRVDLYAREGQVWLGELTPYPAAGLARLEPRSFDEWLGSHWLLPDLK